MTTFNWIDIVIVLFLIASVGRGLRIGFFRQVFAITGFFLGLLIGGLIVPKIISALKGSAEWSVIGALAVLFLAGQLAALGDMAGRIVRSRLRERGPLEAIESVMGIGTSIVSVLAVAWLLAAMFVRLPIAELGNSLDTSAIITRLNATLPSAPRVVEGFGKLVNIKAFPQVFVDVEPQPTPTGPADPAEVQAAADKAKASTVKIQGYGCGGIVTGSGFVAGEGMVATNAHVVAGIRRPIVIDGNGRHPATVVLFDPETDFAVLRTSNLAGPVLKLTTEGAVRGDSAAVLGYPNGGPFAVSGAVVLARYNAMGRNIYGSRMTDRNIYELQANIEQGNSGGPLVLADGTVAGVVFARSVNNEGFGYALSAPEVARDITAASNRTQAVSTGQCTAD